MFQPMFQPMSQHSASRRVYAFRQFRWFASQPLLARSVTLLLATLGWMGLYALLSYRLWQWGVVRGIERSVILLPLCIVTGVLILMGWNTTLRRWRGTVRNTRWAPLRQEELYKLTPKEFEAYVAQHIFARQGYYVHDTPHVKDGGIDVLLEDSIGVHAIVQCKRYRNTVGEATVRELYGTVVGNGAMYGFLATSGGISAEARRWAEDKPMDLLDGEQLEKLGRAPVAARIPAFEHFVGTLLKE